MAMLSDGDESASLNDDVVDIDLPKKKAKKPKKEAKVKKAGITNPDYEMANPNMIKVQNKLVGTVEQNDLYASDDGANNQDN